MVSSFRRSISFPDQPNSSQKSQKSRHFRSLSLPCVSHPLIFQLKDKINELKDWSSSFSSNPNNKTRNSTSLCNGLIQLKQVQESLDDLLQLPQTRESLKGHNDFVEKLLQDFLVFVDVYGILQSLVLKLKEDFSACQVATRRRDESKLTTYAKGVKKMGKDMNTLAVTIQCLRKEYYYYSSLQQDSRTTNEGDPELTGLIKDVMDVTISVSFLLLNGISVGLENKKSSAWSFLQVKKVKVEEGIQEFEEMGSWNYYCLSCTKMADEQLKLRLKRMHEVEDCLSEIQISGEKVFRSLLNTRVTLLNVLTH